MEKPGYVSTHEGYFIIGELNGKTTPRIQELARILSLVKRTDITDNIFKERWDKLCQVTMTIPISSILGEGGGPGILRYENFHTLLARIMSENLRVAAAAGYRFDTMLGLKTQDWQRLARGPAPEVSRILVKGAVPATPPPGTADIPPDKPSNIPVSGDIISRDIARGLPIEMYYLTGYIINKGRENGVPTPVNELILSMLKAMEKGEIKPGLNHLDEMLKKTAVNG